MNTNIIRFIGDCHGKFGPYKRLIANVPRSIVVGDMGVGFRRIGGWRDGEEYSDPPHYAMVRGDHRFIRGNHDNPAAARTHSQYIADGTIEGPMMFIGGALSIDKVYRVENYSWWADEELSSNELYGLVDKYIAAKPEIMVTHECPEEVAELVYVHSIKLNPKWSSRTRQAFQSMWSAHSPKLWIFGHWHCSFDHMLRGTRFICLNELEYRDIDISDLTTLA